MPSSSLVGSWRKSASPRCSDKYPDTMEFAPATYRGTRGQGQGFVWWDAGIYRLDGPHRLVLGTATDELVTYEIRLEGDRLEVVDPEGCRFAYERMTG